MLFQFGALAGRHRSRRSRQLERLGILPVGAMFEGVGLMARARQFSSTSWHLEEVL